MRLPLSWQWLVVARPPRASRVLVGRSHPILSATTCLSRACVRVRVAFNVWLHAVGCSVDGYASLALQRRASAGPCVYALKMESCRGTNLLHGSRAVAGGVQ